MGKRSPKELCPCCGEAKVRSKYGVCKVCGWINDPKQKDDPNLPEGSNHKSLNAAKDEFFSKYEGMLDGSQSSSTYYEWLCCKLQEHNLNIFGKQ